ncbi:MAG: MerR family transcriptional regulator [Spirochaetales bacterium]|nr:MerR family transcriptional regulator [Spirochaetales bacterium]
MRYSIGEVSRLLEVKPYVIRYWEEEIPFVAPQKSRSGRRSYSERDLQVLQRLKHLLHDQRFTIEGARQRLWEELQPEHADLKARIAAVRTELLDILSRMRSRGGRK